MINNNSSSTKQVIATASVAPPPLVNLSQNLAILKDSQMAGPTPCECAQEHLHMLRIMHWKTSQSKCTKAQNRASALHVYNGLPTRQTAGRLLVIKFQRSHVLLRLSQQQHLNKLVVHRKSTKAA